MSRRHRRRAAAAAATATSALSPTVASPSASKVIGPDSFVSGGDVPGNENGDGLEISVVDVHTEKRTPPVKEPRDWETRVPQFVAVAAVLCLAASTYEAMVLNPRARQAAVEGRIAEAVSAGDTTLQTLNGAILNYEETSLFVSSRPRSAELLVARQTRDGVWTVMTFDRERHLITGSVPYHPAPGMKGPGPAP